MINIQKLLKTTITMPDATLVLPLPLTSWTKTCHLYPFSASVSVHIWLKCRPHLKVHLHPHLHVMFNWCRNPSPIGSWENTLMLQSSTLTMNRVVYGLLWFVHGCCSWVHQMWMKCSKKWMTWGRLITGGSENASSGLM